MENRTTLEEIQTGRLTGDESRWCVMGDNDRQYDIISRTPAGLVVRSYVTGILGRVVVTGKVQNRRGMLRCRVEFARDGSFAEGELLFGGEIPCDCCGQTTAASSVGGWINARMAS